ncbi:hypothetical protein QBC46DRAFT_121745 [Diplogelasinospora grovesii]|uniref:Uncharacterized protein n=1 Tax=Diplogelasinospora grovesii TaxID=303347 RepID=A0AAN6N8M6_9PEZI|nr:hypothetical protein QBC46DRAFT_121745 [Diplogelasinospora grovesii]
MRTASRAAGIRRSELSDVLVNNGQTGLKRCNGPLRRQLAFTQTRWSLSLSFSRSTATAYSTRGLTPESADGNSPGEVYLRTKCKFPLKTMSAKARRGRCGISPVETRYTNLGEPDDDAEWWSSETPGRRGRNLAPYWDFRISHRQEVRFFPGHLYFRFRPGLFSLAQASCMQITSLLSTSTAERSFRRTKAALCMQPRIHGNEGHSIRATEMPLIDAHRLLIHFS